MSSRSLRTLRAGFAPILVIEAWGTAVTRPCAVQPVFCAEAHKRSVAFRRQLHTLAEHVLLRSLGQLDRGGLLGAARLV